MTYMFPSMAGLAKGDNGEEIIGGRHRGSGDAPFPLSRGITLDRTRDDLSGRDRLDQVGVESSHRTAPECLVVGTGDLEHADLDEGNSIVLL